MLQSNNGALWVNCRGLAQADFGRDPSSGDSWRARRNFVVFLSGKQRTISPISRQTNFTKFEHYTSIGVEVKTFGTENYTVRVFFQKTPKFLKMFLSCD